MNHVVVDFDLGKLGSPIPTEAAVGDAVELICSLLDTVECGESASFKLDESGDARKVTRKKKGMPWAVLAGMAMLALLVTAGGAAIVAKLFSDRKAEPKTVFVTPKEGA